MTKKNFLLVWLDDKIYKYLLKNVKRMPKRMQKFVAYFYTDARVRKKYWECLNVYMDEGTYSNIGMMAACCESAGVRIGKNVSIAPYVTFIADSVANNGMAINEIDYVRNKVTKQADIVVEDEVWIGTNVTILPGIHVGKCSVIGAGSIVVNDVEPYSIYAGVPAKKIRDLKSGGGDNR